MTNTIIQTRRRIALGAVVAFVSLLADVVPGPRAKLELTTARISVMFDAGFLRLRAFSSSGDPAVSARMTLSIGRLSR